MAGVTSAHPCSTESLNNSESTWRPSNVFSRLCRYTLLSPFERIDHARSGVSSLVASRPGRMRPTVPVRRRPQTPANAELALPDRRQNGVARGGNQAATRPRPRPRQNGVGATVRPRSPQGGGQFAHFRHNFIRARHYRFRGLYTRLVLDQGVMLGLFLVVCQNPAKLGIVPSHRQFGFALLVFLLSAPPKGGERLSGQLVRRDHEHCVWQRVRHIDNAEVSPGSGLSPHVHGDPRPSRSRSVLTLSDDSCYSGFEAPNAARTRSLSIHAGNWQSHW